ncbi:response regulator [Leptolyngbya sp. FACHB-36]|uniref:hybrid sensor histidine kinase/response regulator n=1 Tax=Leptolyngbya sp. FACHB-36 TaxID=2692808 RepID=UPI001680F2E1|nr:response regulator [Leptolyngbya sp. FACHB-36]MBD2022517.1 response regulator [Leptolyngbya sp. FACHB-36]
MTALRFLLLEDSLLDKELIQAVLDEGGLACELVRVQTRDEYLKAIATDHFDLILSDYSLPAFDGISALEIAREQCPDMPFIFVTATLGEELAIETLKRGATDYVLKQGLGRLVSSVRRALREAQEQHDRKLAEHAVREHTERLRLLYDTTRDVLTQQPLELIANVFRKLQEPLELDVYFHYLVDYDQQKLRLAAYAGISEQVAHDIESLDFGQAVCGTVAQQGKQMICPNVQLTTDVKTEVIRSLGIRTYSCQPLRAQSGLFGTLSFGSRCRTQFTRDETDLMQAVCDQMAIAIEQSRLIASLQQRTEQLEQANRIKDEFLAVLSHELRTPMNPILGWAKLLRSRPQDPITTARALETIERNAHIQTQLIEDLLDVSRILRGKLSLNFGPVDLVNIINAALETVHLTAEAKSIQITFSPSLAATSSSPILVSGDAGRLQQVVWNLLSNAVKFTSEGGKVHVTLETGRGECRHGELNENSSLTAHSSSPRYAQIAVTDTGKGITPDFLPHVFDYFRQADGGTTRRFGGLGLGLAIVRHLVELHGGAIQATSEGEGRGATFTVRLPLLRTVNASPDSLSSSPLLASHASPLAGIRVLVVDDEPDTLDFISLLLEQSGAQVAVATCVKEAMTALQTLPPDILVSDIGMPEEDGYSLLARLRSLEPHGKAIPAIALTAYARSEDRDRVLKAGFYSHLTKPVDPVRLIESIVDARKHRVS